MEQEYQIPTDQSIEIETPRNSSPKPDVFQDTTNLIIDKMMSHLTFTQDEFLRNIDWQKKLISQIKAEAKDQPKVDK